MSGGQGLKFPVHEFVTFEFHISIKFAVRYSSISISAYLSTKRPIRKQHPLYFLNLTNLFVTSNRLFHSNFSAYIKHKGNFLCNA